jgi:hypothetical protein
MARFEMAEIEGANLGQANADVFFELGMMYSIRLRREIAQQMSELEIAVAQRAARDWMTTQH